MQNTSHKKIGEGKEGKEYRQEGPGQFSFRFTVKHQRAEEEGFDGVGHKHHAEHADYGQYGNGMQGRVPGENHGANAKDGGGGRQEDGFFIGR